MRRLFFQDFDDVKAVWRSHQIGNLSRRERKRRLFEFRDRLPLPNPAQVPAFLPGTGVFGILFGQLVEFRAFLSLLENLLGLIELVLRQKQAGEGTPRFGIRRRARNCLPKLLLGFRKTSALRR